MYFCGGPLSRRIGKPGSNQTQAPAGTVADGIVARVAGHYIHRSQLDRAVQERLWREGGTPGAMDAEERKRVRHAALDDLIDHELLRAKVAAHAADLKVCEAEINDRVRRFSERFANNEELVTAMTSQGIAGGQDLRERLAARIQQEKYVESCIAPLAKVTDEDARKWFAENRDHLTNPERVEARHIFLPTLERDADEARQVLAGALASLTEGTKDFATLARELSEDPLTKDRSGALGWMTRDRVPADLAEPLFSLPLHKPALVRSKLGWHLIEVTGRKPAEPRDFDDAKPEIVSALEAVNRQEAAADFREALRKSEAANIEIYNERVDE